MQVTSMQIITASLLGLGMQSIIINRRLEEDPAWAFEAECSLAVAVLLILHCT